MEFRQQPNDRQRDERLHRADQPPDLAALVSCAPQKCRPRGAAPCSAPERNAARQLSFRKAVADRRTQIVRSSVSRQRADRGAGPEVISDLETAAVVLRRARHLIASRNGPGSVRWQAVAGWFWGRISDSSRDHALAGSYAEYQTAHETLSGARCLASVTTRSARGRAHHTRPECCGKCRQGARAQRSRLYPDSRWLRIARTKTVSISATYRYSAT